jgi:hypothetical protein
MQYRTQLARDFLLSTRRDPAMTRVNGERFFSGEHS